VNEPQWMELGENSRALNAIVASRPRCTRPYGSNSSGRTYRMLVRCGSRCRSVAGLREKGRQVAARLAIGRVDECTLHAARE
jgi:hypothetical protein